MKKKILLTCCMFVVGLSVFCISGCGKKQEGLSEAENTEEITVTDEKTTDDMEKDDLETVKQTEPETHEEISEDENIASDNEVIRNVTIYYLDDMTAVVVGKSVGICDELDIWQALIDEGILTDECSLLKLEVNEAEGKIDLDFNTATANRINSMGTTGQTEILGCMINTYLEAYGCDKIRLTEEGEGFVTSHGASFNEYVGKFTFE